MSAENKNVSKVAGDIVKTEKFKWSDLIHQEDWQAVWIGFIIIAAGAVGVLTGAFDFSAAKFSTWGQDASFAAIWSGDLVFRLILTAVILGVLFTAGNALRGVSVKTYLPAYIGLFVLAVIVRLISAEYTFNRYLEWAFLALAVGLLIANTVKVPAWLKPAVQTEFYIKTGLVVMGFSVLFSNIVNFGLYGLGIAWIVTPVIIKVSGFGELLGGALIGGTVDSTGAVTVAGTALGELAQTSAVLVKSIQNILIGFIAFAVAIFFTTRVEKDQDAAGKVSAAEIWYRLPKFILGFFAASLIASFVIQPAAGADAVASINKVLDQYKNWAFVLAFTSIGLDTNFREIKEQLQGGKPLVLYIVGQLFNIVLTFIAVYILLSGRFFPLPALAV